MPDAPKRKSSFFQFLLIFAVVYLGSQLLLKTFFPQQQGAKPQGALQLTASNVTVGNDPVLTLANQTASGVFLRNLCPQPPVDVLYRETASGSAQSVPPVAAPAECALPSSVPAGKSAQIRLAPWKSTLFARTGRYEVKLPVYASSGAVQAPAQTLTTHFTVSEPGVFTKIFRTFITKPFLNFLIFVASLLPDHNLGIAIIVLTIIVKLLLFFPTQHALEGQKKMQMLQPKLEELKRKYPKDPQKVQEETVKLWKEHKVNPFQSCLPTLIQLPILIGLFYVVRDGSHLELSRHLIYPFYQNLTWGFNVHFLGLNLLQPNYYIMPPLLVVLQFLQMKLAFVISDRKKAKQQNVIDVKKDGEKKPASATEMQQKMMLYLMPLMIGFFAFQFPTAVALYWGISTLFGIGQQMIVNREHLNVRG